MNAVKNKAFIEALGYISTDVRKSKKYFDDKRLTQNEKNILQCWLYVRDSKFKECFDLLDKMSVIDDELVWSQKLLIEAIAHINKSESQFAVQKLLDMKGIIFQYPLPRQHWQVYHNLFYAYINLKDVDGMKYALAEMKKLPIIHERNKVNYMQCQFNYYAYIGEYKIAQELMQDLDDYRSVMSEAILCSYLIDKFDFNIKIDQYSECENILEEMKRIKKFHYSANFQFMRQLLNHIYRNDALYVYDYEFKDYPIIYHQLKVIALLSAGDRVQAQVHWHELQKLNSNTYQDNFNYHGDKCLFSLALFKYIQFEHMQNKVEFKGNKEEFVEKILRDSSVPINAIDLYKMLWNREPHEKNDLLKLQKIVSRVREKVDFEIKYQKGCYFKEKKKTA